MTVEGYKHFIDAQSMSAFDVNAFLMSQAVTRFDTAADRDAALEQVVTEGMVSYNKDTGELQLYDGSAWQTVAIGAIGAAGSDGQVQYNNGGAFGGASALYFDDVNSRVGIGTATPARPLEVDGGSVGITATFKSTNATGGISLMGSGTTDDTRVRIGAEGDDLKLFSNNVERVRIDSSGNVGIGTATPQTPLGVDGDIDVVGNGRSVVFGRQSETGPHGLEVWDSGSLESALYYRTTPNAWSFENSSGTNILTVDIPNARVGINDSTPSYSLDVNGTGRFTGDLSVDGTISGNGSGLTSLNASNITSGTFPDLFNAGTRYNIGYIDGATGSNYDKLRVYNSSSYTMGMVSGITYGHLGDWAMTFRMNSDNDRGFWWGDTSHSASTGAMSLTTDGRLTVATSLSVGQGESITSPNTSTLYVNGDMSLRSGNAVHDPIYRVGGIYFTWDSDSYGTNSYHSIRSTNGDTWTDAITINSFGNVRINIDSNGNGTNTFTIGRHTTGTANTLLTLDESGNLTVTGDLFATDIDVSGTMRANEFRADDYGPANDASFTFISDEDTGMYRNTTNQLGLSAGGSAGIIVASGTCITAAPSTSSTSGYQYVLRNNTYGTLYRYTSTIELKEQVADFDGSGDLIDALRPVTFVPKFVAGQPTPDDQDDEFDPTVETDAQRTIREADLQYGFIAEEVATVGDGKLAQYEWTEDGQLRAMGWKWPDMIAVLTAEVKSLRARVATLETT